MTMRCHCSVLRCDACVVSSAKIFGHEGGGAIDLDRDIDFGELGPWRRSMNTYDADDGEEDGAD